METDTDQRVCSACNRSTTSGIVEHYEGKRLTRVTCASCDMTERYDAFAKTARLSTWLITDAALLTYRAAERPRPEADTQPQRFALARQIRASLDALRDDVKTFEREVWFQGLQKTVQQARTKGLSGGVVPSALGPLKVMAYAMAGRAMVTIDGPECSVTVITEEDSRSPRMGLQGVSGTAPQACVMLHAVIAAWRVGAVTMTEDSGVSIL